MKQNAAVLSIGNELTNGSSLDTNTQWLSKRLGNLGLNVIWHATARDDLQSIVDTLQHAIERSRVVLVTGGLGPTDDDLTRHAIAKLMNTSLDLDVESLERIEALFKKMKRTMTESNRIQAMMPVGATAIANDYGTAPGIASLVDGTNIYCLPGVPSEMKRIFDEQLAETIANEFGESFVTHERIIRTFGKGESQVGEILGDLLSRDRDPVIGITASNAIISLRLRERAKSFEQVQANLDRDEKIIREKLGELVFGVDDDTLATCVTELLIERKQTLATAESCTGGLIGHMLTEIPGVSEAYLGGVVSYSNQAKMQFLGVQENTLAEYGAVSEETAREMAAGVRKQFNADYGIAVTGIAGPDGGTEEKPVGLVYIAVAHAKDVVVKRALWHANRSDTKTRSAYAALNLLRLAQMHPISGIK